MAKPYHYIEDLKLLELLKDKLLKCREIANLTNWDMTQTYSRLVRLRRQGEVISFYKNPLTRLFYTLKTKQIKECKVCEGRGYNKNNELCSCVVVKK